MGIWCYIIYSFIYDQTKAFNLMKIFHHLVCVLLSIVLVFCSGVDSLAQNGLSKNDSLLLQAKKLLQSNPRESFNLTQEIIKPNNALVDKLTLTEAFFTQGRAASYLGDFDTALLSEYDAIAICPPEEEKLRASIYMQISDLYNRLKDYRQAFEFNDKAMAIYKSRQDSMGIASTYNTRGIIHANLLEYDVAEQCFKNALTINKRLGNIKEIAGNLNNLCLFEGNTKEKLLYIEEAIIINKNLNAKWALCENYNNKAKQLYYAHRYKEALETLLLTQKSIAQIGSKELECDNYEYLSWVYAGLNDYKKAYEALQNLLLLSHDLVSGDKLRSLERSISDRKLRENQKNIELREREIKIESLQRNLLFLTLIMVLLVMTSIFFYRWYMKRKDFELVEAKLSLEKYERELAEIEVEKHQNDLRSIQDHLDRVNREATSFAMFIKSRNDLLETIQNQIKDGYKLNESELKQHLRRINLFLHQYLSADNSSSLLLTGIEDRNKEYIDRLKDKHPDLTKGELNLALLLRIDLSTKDIALLLGSNPKSINMNRYRLRKSLCLETDDNLIEYLQSI